MTRVTITLDAALADALRAEALREECALSCVARHAFARYFTLGTAGDVSVGTKAEANAGAPAASGGDLPRGKRQKKGGR